MKNLGCFVIFFTKNLFQLSYEMLLKFWLWVQSQISNIGGKKQKGMNFYNSFLQGVPYNIAGPILTFFLFLYFSLHENKKKNSVLGVYNV